MFTNSPIKSLATADYKPVFIGMVKSPTFILYSIGISEAEQKWLDKWASLCMVDFHG